MSHEQLSNARTTMGTIEDVPDQVLYDGPSLKFRMSKAWLRAMLDSIPGREEQPGIREVWITGVTIRDGALLFTFGAEPEEENP